MNETLLIKIYEQLLKQKEEALKYLQSLKK